MLEQEFKCLITKPTYDSLINRFSPKFTILQENYFYDTEQLDFLRHGLTVRVRIEDRGGPILQVKKKLSKKDRGVSRKDEFECFIKNVPNFIEVSNVGKLLGEHIDGEKRAFKLGLLTTERSLLFMENNCVFYIDKCEYFDVIDYELEIEFKDSKVKDDFLMKFPIKDIVSMGKYKRFLKRYLKHNK